MLLKKNLTSHSWTQSVIEENLKRLAQPDDLQQQRIDLWRSMFGSYLLVGEYLYARAVMPEGKKRSWMLCPYNCQSFVSQLLIARVLQGQDMETGSQTWWILWFLVWGKSFSSLSMGWITYLEAQQWQLLSAHHPSSLLGAFFLTPKLINGKKLTRKLKINLKFILK